MDIIKKILSYFTWRPREIFVTVFIEGSRPAKLLYHILLEQKKRAGFLSSEETKITNSSVLKNFIRHLKRTKTDYAVLALTHADLAARVYEGINCDLVVVSGGAAGPEPKGGGAMLINDFLRYLKSQPKKYGLKKSLALNMDDVSHEPLVDPVFQILGYGIDASGPDVFRPNTFSVLQYGSNFMIGKTVFHTPLLERLGLYQTLAALVALKALHIPIEGAAEALAKFNPEGALDYFNFGQKYLILQNRAKSAGATAENLRMAHVLKESREFASLICIIDVKKNGSDGDLEKTMRAASDYCNRIFITADAGSQAKSDALIDKASSFLPFEIRDKRSTTLFVKFLDKKTAFTRASEMARPQDVIFLSGDIDIGKPDLSTSPGA